MELFTYVKNDRILKLRAASKKEAFQELISAMCDARGLVPGTNLTCVDVLARIERREEQISTRVSATVAIPHIVVDGVVEPIIVFGLSETGISYDSGEASPIHLMVLMISRRDVHITLLSQISRLLQREDVYEQIVHAESTERAYEIIMRGPVRATADFEPDRTRISRTTFRHSLEMARQTGVRAIVLNADAVGTLNFIERGELDDYVVYLVSHDPNLFDHHESYGFRQVVTIPFQGLNRSNLVELSLLFVLSRGLLGKGDKVLNVFGSPESRYLNTILYTDVEWEFRIFFAIHGANRPGDLEEPVFSRAIQIAHELATEGREGKPVGSLFVLGDYEAVAGFCQQLVINPFRCYPEEERNILDPGLEETIKEYSRIDGAFVVRGDGVIVSAGTYLRTEVPFYGVGSGLGARHAAAATISKVTRAVCVAISESTKRISLFRGGERVMVI